MTEIFPKKKSKSFQFRIRLFAQMVKFLHIFILQSMKRSKQPDIGLMTLQEERLLYNNSSVNIIFFRDEKQNILMQIAYDL